MSNTTDISFTELEWSVYRWAMAEMEDDAEGLGHPAAALPMHDHEKRSAMWDASAKGSQGVLDDLRNRLTVQLPEAAEGATASELETAKKEVLAGARAWKKTMAAVRPETKC